MLILGATGQTGREVVKQALEKNIVVTAYVRNPKITLSDKNVRVVTGEIQDTKALAKAMEGQDAVIVTLGPKKIKDAVMTPATKTVIEAMHEAKVKRIVLLSSFAAHPDFHPPLLMKLVWPMMKDVFEDKKTAEQLLKKSDLAWTIVYATRLTNGTGTGDYNVSDILPKYSVAKHISRADVADFLLQCLEDKNVIGKLPIISAQ